MVEEIGGDGARRLDQSQQAGRGMFRPRGFRPGTGWFASDPRGTVRIRAGGPGSPGCQRQFELGRRTVVTVVVTPVPQVSQSGVR